VLRGWEAQNFSVRKIAPRGFEPLNNNSKAVINKTLTENSNPVLSNSLDKIVQKHPELRELVEVWPNLTEHAKSKIKALIQTHKEENK